MLVTKDPGVTRQFTRLPALQAEIHLAAPSSQPKTAAAREAGTSFRSFRIALPGKRTLFLLFSRYVHSVTTQIRTK